MFIVVKRPICAALAALTVSALVVMLDALLRAIH
jgi:hypothetical protein